mgnify:FL=1
MKNKIYNIEDLKKAIENYGWNVNECDFNCGTGWELYQHSPAGEDFGFAIEHNNNVEKAIEEIKQYANDFDIDEHIEMWIEARHIDNNRLKVPPIRILVEDAENIQEMLDNLSEFCDELDIVQELEEDIDI